MSFLSYLKSKFLSTKTEFGLIDLIVLSSYYLFCFLLFLSLTGLFRKEFIASGLVAGLLFLLAAKKKVVFKKYYLYFLILVPVFFVGIILFAGSFAGDATGDWLPLAREIVFQQKMPDFFLDHSGWITSRVPLTTLFYAGIFSFFGFKASLATILPLFFITATLLLLYQWFQEKGLNKKYLFFVVLLVLTNPIVIRFGGHLFSASFVLFFSTAFFYYLEKYQETKRIFHFLLVLITFVLASAAQETGLILVLPLAWIIIRKKCFKKALIYLPLIFLPLMVWFIRNYLIYDNPVFPYLNSVFQGKYYLLFLTVNQWGQQTYPLFWNNPFARLVATVPSIFFTFFPLSILSLYGFWKKGKIHYIFLFFVFLLILLLVVGLDVYFRYFLPLLGLLVIYALAGLEEIKSKVLLSSVFLINLWGLLDTKVFLSQSGFLSPVERTLDIFYWLAQFVYDYRLIWAVALALFFYFFIAGKNYAKYLILFSLCFYSVKAENIQIGSWLNIWLPILFLIFIILGWRFLINLKEGVLRKLLIAFIIILLTLNSLGLASLYFWVHRQIAFPNFREVFISLPEAAQTIEKLEGENKDFYVFGGDTSRYLNWYYGYKGAEFWSFTFSVITDLKYNEQLTALEIHDLFQASKIKYIAQTHRRLLEQGFYDKIESRPDLFELILQREGLSLWRVVDTRFKNTKLK